MEDLDMAADYSAVLADLRERRDKLNHAISAIEEIMGPSAPSAAPATGAGEFNGMTVVQATIALLRRTGRPLGTSEIARALERGGYRHNSKHFYNTVYGTLSREVEGPVFSHMPNGKWALKEWKAATSTTPQPLSSQSNGAARGTALVTEPVRT